jgi:hypothetical protein
LDAVTAATASKHRAAALRFAGSPLCKLGAFAYNLLQNPPSAA